MEPLRPIEEEYEHLGRMVFDNMWEVFIDAARSITVYDAQTGVEIPEDEEDYQRHIADQKADILKRTSSEEWGLLGAAFAPIWARMSGDDEDEREEGDEQENAV